MNNYFKLSELNISGHPIPEHVADKMLLYHIVPMNLVRECLGLPIWASLRSGWRPLSWELKQGRSGNSEHVFKGKGAVDWTCTDFEENKDELLRLIIELTDYTRITVYDTFIHCDYASVDGRLIYESDSSSNWTFIRKL